jgi:class 3 adenylate cyclase
MIPVISVAGNNDTVGIIMLEHRWDTGFSKVLQEDSPVHAVIENSCGDQFMLKVSGSEVVYFGEGDHHNSVYDPFVVTTSELELLHYWENIQSHQLKSQYFYTNRSSEWIVRKPITNECRYTIRFFPSDEYYHAYVTKKPTVYAVSVAMIFLFTILCFLIYDYLVEKRQKVVMNTAIDSSDIVNQLYPPSFVRRITQTSIHGSRDNTFVNSEFTSKMIRRKSIHGPKELSSLKDFLLSGTLPDSNISSSNVFAEKFTDVTVIFADISGFTAWSSDREPIQVFHLLETIYSAIDKLANDLGVFKVETIGDCYVAVVGLPAPRPAHAVIVCRFAHEIHKCMAKLTKELEGQLGIGTSDLQMRIGIHSGPVTAGVLRGEKSRFQLFGDTMNTAARMESTGKPGRTHVSEDTANFLIKFGKQSWLIFREDRVHAKGKGELQTYWINTTQHRNSKTKSEATSSEKAAYLVDSMQSLHYTTSKCDNTETFNCLNHSSIDDGIEAEKSW